MRKQAGTAIFGFLLFIGLSAGIVLDPALFSFLGFAPRVVVLCVCLSIAAASLVWLALMFLRRDDPPPQ